jgi:hypothetical protein
MKLTSLLNIIIIVLTAIVAADIILTIYDSSKTDYTNLIAPLSIWSGLLLIRTIYVGRQKTLDQLESVRVHKG